MEDFLIKLSVKVGNLRDGSITAPGIPRSPIGTVDIAVLAENGLPAESLSELDKLEDSLKSSQEFKKNLVSFRKLFLKNTQFS